MTSSADGKLLYMADCHVKGRTWANDAGLHGDAREALMRVYSELCAMGLDTSKMPLLIGGDLFDSNRPSSDDLLAASSFLRLFAKTYFIPGNHDSVWPPFIEACFEPDEQTGEDGDRLMSIDGWDLEHRAGYAVGGVSWTSSAEEFSASLRGIASVLPNDEPSYVMLHCGVKELLGYDGTYQVDRATLHDIFRNRPVTLLVGHVHTRATMDLGDGVVLHSPGSLYPCSWDDTGHDHFATLIDGPARRMLDIPCDVRSYAEMDWTDADTVNAAIAELMKADCKRHLPPCVRLHITQPTSYFQGAVDTSKCLVRVVDDSMQGPVDDAPAADNSTVEDAIREELDDEDVADMAVALYNSDDPVAEMESWLDQWEVERLQ